jgi:hypothetical protein
MAFLVYATTCNIDRPRISLACLTRAIVRLEWLSIAFIPPAPLLSHHALTDAGVLGDSSHTGLQRIFNRSGCDARNGGGGGFGYTPSSRLLCCLRRGICCSGQ